MSGSLLGHGDRVRNAQTGNQLGCRQHLWLRPPALQHCLRYHPLDATSPLCPTLLMYYFLNPHEPHPPTLLPLYVMHVMYRPPPP